ncbi:hypothetical protein GXW74_19445 [Roseomonas eburnea]|uniref:Uncharacterized protein n=1 Tax=Neoroseomonas eburnea TaxID=1346889 RepID=A0A9X9XG40_9PROT|nr:hypothetical protein [Neoroseomonas eburnea]MBR0682676.1 hypothetical protein [Neoroseomonas eburnea]
MELSPQELSADAVHAYVQERKRRDDEERRSHDGATKAEREKLHREFLERDIPPDAMSIVATLVRRAVDTGDRRALLFQFPSDWLPDSGRAVTNHDADWHDHLEGFAQRAYAYYERELKPRGFQLRAEILDWSDGMPGDVGFYLQWKRPDEE